MRLDREALVEELFEEVLADLLAHEHAAAARVVRRAAGAAHHLEDVCERVVDVAVLLACRRARESAKVLETHSWKDRKSVV